jgi:hypothetical protein
MSEARRRRGLSPWILLLALLPAGIPGPVRAQTPPDTILPALGRAVDSLLTLSNTLGRRADHAEYLRKVREREEKQVPVDTFTMGPFHLVSLPSQRELAEAVFTRGWEELEPLAGTSEQLFEPWTFLVHYYWSRDEMLLAGDSLFVRVDMSRRFPRGYLERKVVRTLGEVLMKSAPPELSEWAGGQLQAPASAMPWIARELLTTASMAVRRCYQGEMESCAEATGLRGNEGAWDRWYTAAERRLYVQGMGRPRDAAGAALWEGCAVAGMEDACDVILRGRELEAPLTAQARASLLGHALSMGGPDAFRRLRGAADGGIAQRLEAAAGVPLDSLLASWRTEVLQARRSAWAGLARSPLALFFWVFLFGALATRSTRWRLG